MDKVTAEKLPIMPDKVKFLKLPNSITKRLGVMAFSIPKKSVIRMVMLFGLAELLFATAFVIQQNFIFLIFLVVSLVLFGFIAVVFFMFSSYPIIAIRKDCSECQFNFHIIAHELNHLRLNSSDETIVEETTIEETKNRLIPLLLSNPEICKDCFFKWRIMFLYQL